MKLLLPLPRYAAASYRRPVRSPAPVRPRPAKPSNSLRTKASGTPTPATRRALPGGRLFAEADGLTFALLADGGPAQHGHGGHATDSSAADRPAPVRGHALTLRFVRRRPRPRSRPKRPRPSTAATSWAPTPSTGPATCAATAPCTTPACGPASSARVYESADQQLEYDFELAPGANPAAIGLRHDGRRRPGPGRGRQPAGENQRGHRHGAGPAGLAARCGRPAPGRGLPLRAGRAAPSRFALGRYDHARPLTIDPVVVFSTYTGSTGRQLGLHGHLRRAGQPVLGRHCLRAGLPGQPGARSRPRLPALIDIALIKYNTSATGPAARVWATYLGGSSADFPHSLVVNSQGELLVLGSLELGNYPTTAGALQRTFRGRHAGRPVCGYGAALRRAQRLGPGGYAAERRRQRRWWAPPTWAAAATTACCRSTQSSPSSATPQLAHNYGDPFRGDILVDAADNVYIASHTTSTNFPVARGFSSTYRGGTSDGVVCKLTPTLTALTWGSYLGGSGADAAYSIQLEPASGDVYVAGGTAQRQFPGHGGRLPHRPARRRGWLCGAHCGQRHQPAAGHATWARPTTTRPIFCSWAPMAGCTCWARRWAPSPSRPACTPRPTARSLFRSSTPTWAKPAGHGVWQHGPSNTAPSINLAHGVSGRPLRPGVRVRLGRRREPATAFSYLARPTAPPRPAHHARRRAAQHRRQRLLPGAVFGGPHGARPTARTTATPRPAPKASTWTAAPRASTRAALCTRRFARAFRARASPFRRGPTPTRHQQQLQCFGRAATTRPSCSTSSPTLPMPAPTKRCAPRPGRRPLAGTPAGGIWTGPGVTGSVATGFVFTPSLSAGGRANPHLHRAQHGPVHHHRHAPHHGDGAARGHFYAAAADHLLPAGARRAASAAGAAHGHPGGRHLQRARA